MKIRNLHHWYLPTKEAVSLQKRLSKNVSMKNQFGKIRLIAGADIAVNPETNEGFAGVIVYTYPELKVVEKQQARMKLSYPYIPGLLSFREAPVLLKTMKKLKEDPDLIVFDGQGIAHPRGLGIASHMGLLLDKPTIGCAKSLLVGQFKEPGRNAASTSPLIYKGNRIGTAVRMRKSVKPVFISPGHRIDIATSAEIILKCGSGFRIPKPTREADQFVAQLKKTFLALN